MGIGDRSAFPEHLDEQSEVDATFPDDGTGWLGKLRRRIKHWGAFGYRSPAGIAFCHLPPFIFTRKWRRYPRLLFAVGGEGPWRLESDDADYFARDPAAADSRYVYVSRNQYWKRWHIALHWPLFISGHFYKKDADVPPLNYRPNADGKIYNFYIGAKRDADGIFWWPAVFLGRNFK